MVIIPTKQKLFQTILFSVSELKSALTMPERDFSARCGAMTFSITAFSITTLSITIKNGALSTTILRI